MLRKELVKVALGEIPADIVIKNGNLANVNTSEIVKRVDVAIKEKRIALVGAADHCIGNGTSVVRADGKYLVPGLLDAHVHIESSMVTPTQFARAVLPRGTTGVFIDPHEIANVLGLRGVELFINESKGLPLKVFVTIPSCIPSAPGLETAGAEFGPEEIARGLELERVVGLGEVMNFPGVLAGDGKMYAEMGATLERRGVIEGHAPGLLNKELCAYVAAGISSDHESFTPEEAVQKLRLGVKLEIREGSEAKNLATLVKPILELGLDTKHCLLATDDRHPSDLIKEGHIDHLVRRAIEEGVDPIKAIQMATVNTAEHFKVDQDLGSISPGKIADILVIDDLEKFSISMVIADGRLVAEDGKLVVDLPTPEHPEFVMRTMNLRRVSPKDFVIKIPTKTDKVDVRVIEVVEGRILTEHGVKTLKVEDGGIMPDLTNDIVKVAVVERHRNTGNIGLGFVKGFGIKEGAIASSVGHDAHNIIVIGASEADMAVAVNTVAQMRGGQVAVKQGEVLARVELPIAGLMSNDPVEVVSVKLDDLNNAVKGLGIKVGQPFMRMSFLPLAVIPKLRITDKGLVDVEKFSLVNLAVK
jgi:adenine deaminase